jgi:hypothetical protein
VHKVVSVFFYGYGSSLAPVGAFIASTDPANFTLYNLVVFPMIGGYIAVIPQLGKMFSELSKDGLETI